MIYLSIDVEASGPCPGVHSLVSVGAAPVTRGPDGWRVDEDRTFYRELAGTPGAVDVPEAMAVHGLDRAHLEAEGAPPEEAMRALTDYLSALHAGSGAPIRSAAWPSSFDHGYVSYYLWRFTGDNPLGHSGFDIASYAMGRFGVTSRRDLRRAMTAAGYRTPHNPRPHHALHDAIEQGWTLAWLLDHADR